MTYEKPKVTIDLEEYETLKKRSMANTVFNLQKGDRLRIRYNENPVEEYLITNQQEMTNGFTFYYLSGSGGNVGLEICKKR